eukprot:CAMPEP_0172548952 /NCGR_PEP_ID=MMETSP1067-20121228/18139_1 /TAXON_ID=265564 ORGANISM="Thalassiosira punctigera, Strain Tpunct2005C2" /NCGR_SAMPLE_ID=MMETSP1067 /ASSEMBLY_ACC=CAM_ASM_000444 /LENGTH=338 /DNA_ID=CAMNT_0013336259 /DNA_START=334 /DNA_END=1350 /DNA_ORIENTATION=+
MIVDVVSIGSTSRPEYLRAQNETWIRQRHDQISVRNFFALTEEHHPMADDTCDATSLLENAAICLEQSNDTAVRRGVLSYGNITNATHAKLWYCAQKRPAIGLGRVVADTYFHPPKTDNAKKEDLPDWLLLVDDDTLFRMDVFHTAVSQLDCDESYVIAGRHIPFDYPYGGWGTALSKGALVRLYQPIHCSTVDALALGNKYHRHVCAMLQINMADELSFFVDGDSLADLMLKIALGQSTAFALSIKGNSSVISAPKRTPFCYHSDWLSGYFFSHYILLGHTIPLFPSCPEPLKCWIPPEILTNEREINAECGQDLDIIACHYQTPEMMRRAVSNVTS